jgi:hypothetical protein
MLIQPATQFRKFRKVLRKRRLFSHTDSKRSLFEKAYHFVKNIALKNKLNLINSLQPEKSILILVPEQEIFCQLLKNNGWHTDRAKRKALLQKRKVFHLLKKPAN